MKIATTTALTMISALAAQPVFASTVFDDVPTGWVGQGSYGSGTADGDIAASPTVSGNYTFVTTDPASGAKSGAGALADVGGPGSPTSGSTLTTSSFTASAGETLQFFFNYLTSDGSGFADYAWARLLDDTLNEVALLFTARTTPGGNTVPGFEMPLPAATLSPGSVLIDDNATDWTAIGGSSGTCFNAGCGSTGWVESLYDIDTDGTYSLQFGATNWDDTAYQSGMAIAGANIGGVDIDPDNPVGPSPIPLPAAGWLLMAGMGGLAAIRRRKKR